MKRIRKENKYLNERMRKYAFANDLKNHKFESCKELIELGIDVNDREADYLKFAGDDVLIVKFLADNGVDINRKDKNDHTQLYNSLKTPHENTCKLLIKLGAELSEAEKSISTPEFYKFHQKIIETIEHELKIEKFNNEKKQTKEIFESIIDSNELTYFCRLPYEISKIIGESILKIPYECVE